MRKITFENALKFIEPNTNYWIYSDMVNTSFKAIPKIENNVITIIDHDRFDVCFDKNDKFYITKTNMLKIRSFDDGCCEMIKCKT